VRRPLSARRFEVDERERIYNAHDQGQNGHDFHDASLGTSLGIRASGRRQEIPRRRQDSAKTATGRAQLSSSSLSPVWPISTSRSLARAAQGLAG
jgi:hypothetical protein